jgi:hypothetical protein
MQAKVEQEQRKREELEAVQACLDNHADVNSVSLYCLDNHADVKCVSLYRYVS